MKKEEIIDENWMKLLKGETQILRRIRDAHPFVLNLIGVMETQVCMWCIRHTCTQALFPVQAQVQVIGTNRTIFMNQYRSTCHSVFTTHEIVRWKQYHFH